MNRILPLMRREWLQHRMAWSLMLLLPLALAVLMVSFGKVQTDPEERELIDNAPAVLVFAAMAAGTVITLAVVVVSSMILMAGLARRDHGDRSNEFWLSLPVGHGEALGVPLLVHLLLLPAVAIGVGLMSGLLVSIPLVARTVGFGEWLAQPWGVMLPAVFTLALRMLAGLPLALLWLSPIVLGVVLLGAWFGRWGIVIAAAGIGIGSGVMDYVFGQPWPAEVVGRMLQGAAQSLVGARPHTGGGQFDNQGELLGALGEIGAWARGDFVGALGALASPEFVGGLVFAALCFWALMRWRARGV